MLLDLWDKDSLIKSFMKIYNLSDIQICSIFQRIYLGGEKDYVQVFCEETGILLDSIDIARDVMLLGKIVSTTVDNNRHLKEHGLLHLNELLEQDSPISRHLQKFGIKIIPSKQEAIIGKKTLFIPKGHEKCRFCYYGHEKCAFYDREDFCPYYSAMSLLSNKLYHDNSEIELFLTADENSMLNYSTVSEYPEIFSTIEDLINRLSRKSLPIGTYWMKEKTETILISVFVNYNDLSFKSNYLGGGNLDSEIALDQYGHYLGEWYSSSDEVPKCIWDNIWLINTCLEIITEPKNYIHEMFAGIKNELEIPYSMIKIEEFPT